MFIIDFNAIKKRFELSITDCIDRDEFMDNMNYLKTYYFPFDYDNKIHHCDFKHFEEYLLWFERDGKQFQVTDLAKEVFQKYKEIYYKREVTFFRNRLFDNSILNKDVVLKKFQEVGINWRLQRNAYIDAFDTGTGKTISNICVFSYLYKNNIIDGIIILVPTGLSYDWQEEILNKVNIFKKEDIQIIDNLLKVRCFEKFENKKILIIRHDLYADCIASYHKRYSKMKSLKDLHWNTSDYVNIKKMWNKKNIFLCIDECDSFNHLSAIKTKALFSTKKYLDYKALLSATPWMNGIEDSYSLLTFIDHSIIPMEEEAFRLWLAKDIGGWNKYDIKEYNIEHVQELMKSYKHVFIQNRKEDLEEIKTVRYFKDIKCQVVPEQQQMYEKITEYQLSILQEEYDRVTWKLLEQKMHLILEVFDNPLLLKKRIYDNDSLEKLLNKWSIEQDNKFIYLKNRLEHLIEDQKKKVIIYDIHPTTIEILAEKFIKYKPLIIHGELKVKDKEKDRKEKEQLFNYDPNHKLIILSSYTSSRGINLQYGASNIIHYSLPFNAIPFKQGSERTDRTNSINDSTIESLYYPHTIDQYRYNKVVRRMEFNKNMDQEVSQEDLNRLLNGVITNN